MDGMKNGDQTPSCRISGPENPATRCLTPVLRQLGPFERLLWGRKAFEKFHQLPFVFGPGIALREFLIDVRVTDTAAEHIVHGFVDRFGTTVMKVRTGFGDAAQRRSLKGTHQLL